MVAQALPFATVPSVPLREHFTEWLMRSLAHTALRSRRAGAEAQRIGPVPSSAAALGSPHPSESECDAASDPGTRTEALGLLHPPESEGIAAPVAEVRTESVRAANGPAAKRRREPAGGSSPGPAASAIDPEAPPETADPVVHPRPQFVRQSDPTVWVTKAFLRSRGWTEAAVRDFLPEPEGLKPNPRFPAFGAPMQVWRPETVGAAEGTPEWRAWLERSLRRRRTSLETLAASDDADFRVRLGTAAKAIEAHIDRSAEVCAERTAETGGKAVTQAAGDVRS